LTALVLLLASGALTLVKSTFSIISNNFDPTRDTDELLKKIVNTWERTAFMETISSGRFICNNTASILLFWLSMERLQTWYTVWQSALLSLVTVWIIVYSASLFLPNLAGNFRPYTMARAAWVLMRVLGWIFWIPGRLSQMASRTILHLLGYDERLDFLTDEQRHRLDSDTSRDEIFSLEDDEKEMIRNIFEFGQTPVREIMTPRVNMVALELNTPLEKVLEILNEERHSRVPVYRENPDNIVGLLYNRDFLQWYSENKGNNFQLQSLIKPAYFVPHTKKIDDLMRELRKSRNQQAIVVDEYGGTAGLVTLEDILEEIVGEIHDEDDGPEDAHIIRQKDGTFLIDPVISLGDLQDELAFTFPAEDEENKHKAETLSGLIQAIHGAIPRPGEEIETPPLMLKVMRVNGTRIEKVLASFVEGPLPETPQ